MYTNAITNHEYSIANQMALAAQAQAEGFKSEKVAGFKQWSAKGLKIKKGSKAASITMICERKDKKTGEKKTYPKTLKVFFEDQTEAA